MQATRTWCTHLGYGMHTCARALKHLVMELIINMKASSSKFHPLMFFSPKNGNIWTPIGHLSTTSKSPLIELPSTVEPPYNGHPGGIKLWPLYGGGLNREVHYNSDSEFILDLSYWPLCREWPLFGGGR